MQPFNLKEILISSALTFLSGFAIVIVAQIDTLSYASVHDGTILGLVFAAVRAGIKATLQAYLAYRSQ